MFNFITQFLLKNYYLVSFSIYIIFNIGILDNAPFSDDYYHVFNHSFFRDNSNPLLFFSPWSQFFKSWGLTYTYFWLIFELFDKNIVLCRVLNLCLHFTNHILFKKYLETKIKSPGRINTLSLLFLFSPLSVLTTTWIFQAKTLLAVLFMLLFLIKIEKTKLWNLAESMKISFLFFLSITAKVVAILLPFYVFFRLKEKFNIKKSAIIVLPLFLISLIYGVLNIKGITYLKSELNIIASPTINVKKNYILEPEKKKDPLDIKVFNEISQGSKYYFAPFTNLGNLADKHIISLQNFSRLVLSTVGINQFLPFYENNLTTILNKNLYLHIFFALSLIFLAIFLKNKYLLPTVLLLVPISGYFYVPYMKHSYTSDHWFYPASIFVLLLINNFVKSPKHLMIFIIPIMSAFTLNITQYYDFDNLIQKNYASNKNPFILELMIQENIKHEKKKLNYGLHDFILKNEDFNNPLHYKGLLSSRKSLKDKNLYNYFGRFAVDQIKSEDLESYSGFLNKHQELFTKKQLDLSSFLGVFYKHEINQQEYERVIELLK